jgi:RNA polymerase sigma-70 factor (ECF subfamily)
MNANQFTSRFNKYTPYLNAFAMKLTKDPCKAKDLFQDTAFRAFRNQDKFTTDINMKSWLTTIMKNAFINDYRKRLRNREVSDNTEDMIMLHSMNNSTKNGGEENIMFDELTSLIEDLDEGLKKPFLMAFQGYKYDEISEEMNMPLGTIKSRIFIARKILKGNIQKLYNAKSSVEMAA